MINNSKKWLTGAIVLVLLFCISSFGMWYSYAKLYASINSEYIQIQAQQSILYKYLSVLVDESNTEDHNLTNTSELAEEEYMDNEILSMMQQSTPIYVILDTNGLQSWGSVPDNETLIEYYNTYQVLEFLLGSTPVFDMTSGDTEKDANY